jgi:enterochelin esterase-like enzyme
LTTNIYSQFPGRRPTPNDTLVSPKVLPDNRVKFSIYAPKATNVTITGDYKTSWGMDNLVKDSLGVWSFITEPLVPDFYTYTLVVDEVRTFDPKNPMVKQGVTGIENIFEVPGKENEFQNNNPVPHGDIRIIWYESKSLGQLRRMHIYTPPGYDKSNEQYPVFYLQHGGGDDDVAWSTVGRAGFILDNLIAENKIKPMIVVMADGSRTRSGRFQPGQSLESIMNNDRFGDDLHKDIIPYVESHYRVIANRENRAFAGLSMGGLQVLWFGLPRMDQFAYFGIFSMGIAPAGSEAYVKLAEPFFKDPEKTNKEVKLLWVGYGKNDFLAQSAANMIKLFDDHKIKYVLNESEGGHTWVNWRHYLYNFAQLLFK